MNTVFNVDLSGQWDFTPEGGEQTKIIVPGGGWLHQGFDCEAAVYSRYIFVPDILSEQSVILELGAVNHIASYYIGKDETSLQKIHEEVTAFTGQTVNLTPYVKGGQKYLLKIHVRAFENGRPVAPHWAEWSKNIARGIFRFAKLHICPPVVVQDVFVKTDVKNNWLKYDVTLCNNSKSRRTVKLAAALSAYGTERWEYPALPQKEYVLETGESFTLSVSKIDWTPGKASYWWHNQPYRADYRATLHCLNLTLTDESAGTSNCCTRFGFREFLQQGKYFTLNGVRIKLRGDNLQVANYDGISYGETGIPIGKGDAIDTLPGFLPPRDGCTGWPGAVDNFLRLNYNIQRQHMGPWTPYMLDVCDEMGLMLIGESACRWNGFDMEDGRGFNEVKCLQDIIRRDRNHPSIIRWCIKNESQCTDPAYHLELYNAVKSVDDSRPIYEDIVFFNRNELSPEIAFADLTDKEDFTWIEHYLTTGQDGNPRFTTIDHNDCLVPLSDRPYGIGEADWMRSSTPAGLAWFAVTIALLRAKGASDIRPYTLLSSWCSCIPGCKTTDFLTEENRHPVYGENNLPQPFEHPGIKLLQAACNPIFALDYDFWYINRRSNAFGMFPVTAPQIKCDSFVVRTITIFNDDLSGENLELHWELREGSPSNWISKKGQIDINVPVAGITTAKIKLCTPVFNSFVFLHLAIVKDGQERFVCDNTCYETVGGKDFTSEFNGAQRTFL